MSEVRCRYCGRRGHGDPCAVCAKAGEMYPQGTDNSGPAPSPVAKARRARRSPAPFPVAEAPKVKRRKKR